MLRYFACILFGRSLNCAGIKIHSALVKEGDAKVFCVHGVGLFYISCNHPQCMYVVVHEYTRMHYSTCMYVHAHSA